MCKCRAEPQIVRTYYRSFRMHENKIIDKGSEVPKIAEIMNGRTCGTSVLPSFRGFFFKKNLLVFLMNGYVRNKCVPFNCHFYDTFFTNFFLVLDNAVFKLWFKIHSFYLIDLRKVYISPRLQP